MFSRTPSNSQMSNFVFHGQSVPTLPRLSIRSNTDYALSSMASKMLQYIEHDGQKFLDIPVSAKLLGSAPFEIFSCKVFGAGFSGLHNKYII